MDYFQTFKCSIARIFAVNNGVIGAGFLVSDRHLLTCAHVVAAALELPNDTAEMPSELVEFDLPLLNAGRRVSGKVVFWRPVSPGQMGEDLAVLEVDLGVLPVGAQAVRLMVADEPWGHPFQICGFPDGQNNGFWTTGLLRERQGAGWVQMEADRYAIEHGFSGAPVWDETLEAVVGMVVAADLSQNEATAAFMIPTSIISQAWSGLAYVDLEYILHPVENQLVRNLAVAYFRTCPNDMVFVTPKTLSAQIKCLVDMKDVRGHSALVRFVAFLVIDLESDESIDSSITIRLRNWLQQQTTAVEDILQQVEQRERINSLNSYLMIIVNAMTGEDRYQLTGWVISDAQDYNARTGRGSVSLVDRLKLDAENIYSLQEIKSVFLKMLDEACSLCENFTIEFFLPAKLLNQDLDLWEFEESIDFDEEENFGTTPIGHTYPVILRSTARLKSDYLKRYRGDWQRKCQEVLAHAGQPASDLLVAGDDRHHNEIYKELRNAKKIKVGIHLVNERLYFGKESNFAALQKVAAPVAIWLRKDMETAYSIQIIENVLCHPLADLPEIVRQQRGDSIGCCPEEHIGHHLALIWDDFDRLPPYTDCNELKMG
jgi:vWA-MoxR associated protein C-terminal domain/Trypsin-like peptidase domain/vWA-MoxR associated protein middle region (VMAP-M) 1